MGNAFREYKKTAGEYPTSNEEYFSEVESIQSETSDLVDLLEGEPGIELNESGEILDCFDKMKRRIR